MTKFFTIITTVVLLASGISYYTYLECSSGACPFENVLYENLSNPEVNIESNANKITQALDVPTQKDNGSELPKQETITPGPLKVLKSIVTTVPVVITPAGVTEWTNYERVEGKLLPLVFSPTLAQAASAKVDDMFSKQYFEHVSPTGVAVDDLAELAGYAYVVIGENLALGNFKDDRALVTAWMESPGHRANIMNSRFQEIGVSAKRGIYEGREVWLAVQEFGKPLSSCPSINPSLKELIEYNKQQTEGLESKLKTLQNELEAMQPKHGGAYNNKVNEYNSLVAPYNELVKATKDLVDSYNAQVKSFNECAVGAVQ